MSTEQAKSPENNGRVESFRQGRLAILTKEAHLAYVSAMQRTFSDRKVSRVVHVVISENANDRTDSAIMVAADPGMPIETCRQILLSALKTLDISESKETPIDNKEQISS